MALNFPDNPSVNDTYQVGLYIWTWNGIAWTKNPSVVGPTGPAYVYESVNTQASTAYTFNADDHKKLTSFTSSSAITATIPPNSSVPYTVGSHIDITQNGTGKVTVVGDTGVTIRSTTTTSTRTQYSIISFIKINTNEWLATGDLGIV